MARERRPLALLWKWSGISKLAVDFVTALKSRFGRLHGFQDGLGRVLDQCTTGSLSRCGRFAMFEVTISAISPFAHCLRRVNLMASWPQGSKGAVAACSAYQRCCISRGQVAARVLSSEQKGGLCTVLVLPMADVLCIVRLKPHFQ